MSRSQAPTHVRIKHSDSIHSGECDTHTMICPGCGQLNLAQNNKLQQTNLEIKIKCINCCILSSSMEWKCNCGVKWHTCQRHALKAASTKADAKCNTVARKASKRPLLSANIGQILDDDLKHESKLARKHPFDEIIDLGYAAPAIRELKLGMIPLILRERFHLATSSSSSI